MFFLFSRGTQLTLHARRTPFFIILLSGVLGYFKTRLNLNLSILFTSVSYK